MGSDGKPYLVNLLGKSCSCRFWDIEKYPCVHGLASYIFFSKKDERSHNFEFEDLIYKYYWMELWALTYHMTIYVVPYRSEWIVPDYSKEKKIIPPKRLEKKERKKVRRFPSAGKHRPRTQNKRRLRQSLQWLLLDSLIFESVSSLYSIKLLSTQILSLYFLSHHSLKKADLDSLPEFSSLPFARWIHGLRIRKRREMKKLKQHYDMLGFIAEAHYGIQTGCPCGGRIVDEVSTNPKNKDFSLERRYFTCSRFKDDGLHFRQPWVIGVQEEVDCLRKEVDDMTAEIAELKKLILRA
ncbi:hypothetical protein N665_0925s0011 [Sinapis alba]|nr:hypothetical protein N665_0925s0011 [Sinapis alba]